MLLRQGIVVDTHPEDHSVDLVMADDGARLTGVQVLTPNGSTRTGTVDMPKVPPKGDKWDITKRTGQDQQAVVAFIGGRHPVVIGFLFPQINQMLFRDKELALSRHQSDVMWSMDKDGNIQVNHPSGTYIRIGEQPDNVDLTQQNEDASLGVDRNTGRRVHMRIGFADGTLELTMTPQGEVLLTCDKNINFQTKEDIRMEAGGVIKFKAPSGMTFDTPNGHFTNISTAVTDFIANNKSLVNHTHPGVVSGPSNTGVTSISGDSSGPDWDGIVFPSS